MTKQAYKNREEEVVDVQQDLSTLYMKKHTGEIWMDKRKRGKVTRFPATGNVGNGQEREEEGFLRKKK